jgi:alpha-D-xyloside xylohydrolase
MFTRLALIPCLAAMTSVILSAADVSGPQPVQTVTQQADGVLVRLQTGMLKIQVCADDIVHVQAMADQTLPTAPSVPVIATWEKVPFTVQNEPSAVTVATATLRVQVDKTTGVVRFLNANGTTVLAERERRFTTSPSPVVAKEPGLSQIEQTFATQADESLYGLGQFQDGIWDFRGIPLELRQHNTVIALPMLISSKGYGVLWDNASLTQVNPIDQVLDFAVPGDEDSNAPKATEELGTVEKKRKKSSGPRIATFTTTTAGDYVFMAKDGDRRDRLEVLVNDRAVASVQNMWVPYSVSGAVTLPANTQVKVELRGGGKNAKVVAQRRQNDRMVFRSEAGVGVDYWFFYGPNPNRVIAGYRTATGDAPLWPKWAFGFWQCRERYSSSQHLLNTITEFRTRKLPVDLIVQDWQYWGKYGWGAYQWDEKSYPDPTALCTGLHALNTHFMVSIWPNPEGTAKKTLSQLPHGFIPHTSIYDPTSADTRAARWGLINQGFFSHGVDAWWQDAAEPLDDGNGMNNNRTAMGLGNLYRNAFPLFHNRSVYDGQRATDPDKRVVTLTRSAYPGQQRYSAATWSGDINGTWETFRRQIPAGLNLSITGQPYWTSDCGGFFHPKNQHTSEDFNELWTRWFQYLTLSPIQRVHGYQTETEVWKWLPKTQEVMRAYLDLRYRLLPYTYSQAWAVTHDRATLMRPLVLDFPTDARARAIGDQYLFGPALLISPVIEPAATTRTLYLPSGTTWLDFWSGESLAGGQNVTRPAPIEQIPVQVRAGSILPLGPTLQWANEKPAETIELRVYPGANGSFTLYEDEGDSYRYEQGAYATIPITWNDETKRLTIGARQGSFPGMLKKRTFKIVMVRPGHGTGITATTTPDQVVAYDGTSITVKAR